MADKPKFKIKDYEFVLSDDYLALCLVLQELILEIRRIANK